MLYYFVCIAKPPFTKPPFVNNDNNTDNNNNNDDNNSTNSNTSHNTTTTTNNNNSRGRGLRLAEVDGGPAVEAPEDARRRGHSNANE